MRNPADGNALRLLRVLGSIAIIAAITFLESNVIHVNSTTVALTLLLAVLGIAARWGLPEAISASMAGMLCLNYFFLPPIGTWTIEEPQNWVALVAFVVVSIVASQLSTSVARRAEEATSRQRELERLYLASQSLMRIDGATPVPEQIARRIGEAFNFPYVRFEDLATRRKFESTPGGGQPALVELPVEVGGNLAGILSLPGLRVSETALRAIAQLASVAIERARDQEAATRAEAVRQSEQMKSVMLDAVAHEFKTPLTSIKAAVSSLRNAEPSAPLQQELLEIMDEESDRMNSMVTEAIQVARIEAGRIELRRQPQAMGELIEQVLDKPAGALDPQRVEVLLEGALPPVAVDAELMRIVLRQLVDNAAKYSPQDSPIRIEAGIAENAMMVRVSDSGPGIPEGDRQRIFEKFYRGPEARDRVAGTGMGLAIARAIVQAHGGGIWAASGANGGAVLAFTIPLTRQEAAQ